MLLAAGHSWRPDQGLGRWTGALIVTVALHGGVAAAGLMAWESIVPPTPPPAAIMMELAPLPVSPPAPSTQAAQEPPPPEAPPAPMVEPEPLPEPPMLVPLDPVSPAMREPDVVLPKPLPKKPKVQEVVEAPKEQPKEQPKPEKPKEKVKEKPKEKLRDKDKDKPVAKPEPKAEPTVAQDTPPQPSQQAAAVAAPLQQAAVPSAPSAADIARRANAESNWQGLLLAHLEKHKKYPKSARKRHEQGTSFLRFRMDRGGTVLSYALARSSGYTALDEEVLAMIARAQPLPALPAEMTETVVEIVVPVQFTLR